ncbi:Glycosyl transferases group 1 [Desmophyllum pertusum]|uniref:Glycosyl transferases group 1 n=1 Tax=Desmophyllum pertusum TaxID=174260 RepID=A0A9W9YPH2_9CNID|nr:Glycosyl transferases group 1 [Desmophyllum pertusum]
MQNTSACYQGTAENIDHHIKRSIESHLDMMNFSSHQCNKKNKEMEEKKKEIEKLLRDLEGSAAVGANAGVVSSQMEEIMHALREHEKEVNNLQGELTRLNLAAATPTGHDFRPNSVSAFREGERRLDRTEHQLALQEIQLSEQDLQIQMLEATSYNGTYIWKSTITADDFKKLLLEDGHQHPAHTWSSIVSRNHLFMMRIKIHTRNVGINEVYKVKLEEAMRAHAGPNRSLLHDSEGILLLKSTPLEMKRHVNDTRASRSKSSPDTATVNGGIGASKTGTTTPPRGHATHGTDDNATRSSKMDARKKPARNKSRDTKQKKPGPGSSQRFLRDMMDAMKQSMTENKALRENERRLEQHIRSSGLQMRDEIPNDGNCLFHAIADQMERLGECSHDHTSLRTLAVETLKNGLHSIDDITSYVPNNDLKSYLKHMSNDGTWGDHIVLVALADALGKTIRVVSSLDTDNFEIVVEAGGLQGAPLLLGHLSENHYVSLEPVNNSTSNVQGIYAWDNCL